MSTTAERPIDMFAAAVDTIRTTPFTERPGEPQPDGYYGALLAEDEQTRRHAVEVRMRYMQDVFRFARTDPRGLDVLEAGSGFGVGLVAVASLGARSVAGVELVGWQAEWARACAARLPGDLPGRIVVHHGTVTDMPIPDRSVHVVLSLEAISHYYDYKPFLAEAARVLRPGGVLIVSDGNNGLNPKIRRHTEALWAIHEVDPRTYVHDPDGPITGGAYNPWLLVAHRHRIVLERAEVSDDDAYRIALNTAGMLRREVEAATDDFVRYGVYPHSPYVPGTLSVHPDMEMVMERLFDPWRLGAEIAGYGFGVRVRGHWAGASGRRLHRLADGLLGAVSPLSMRTARGFRIAATRLHG